MHTIIYIYMPIYICTNYIYSIGPMYILLYIGPIIIIYKYINDFFIYTGLVFIDLFCLVYACVFFSNNLVRRFNTN